MVLPPGGFPQLFLLSALAALCGGLAAVERKGAFQLMLSRPIVLAPLLGALLGDARTGLLLGVPLELLFLGGVNLGGNLPDNETLLAAALTAMVVPAARAARLADPALLTLGFALLFPLAHLGRSLERASERRNGELLEIALARAAAGDARAARVNLRGMLLPFGATAGICVLCVLASPALAAARLALSPRLVSSLEGGWKALWVLAAASAIRAVRTPHAKLAAALSAAAIFALFFATRSFF